MKDDICRWIENIVEDGGTWWSEENIERLRRMKEDDGRKMIDNDGLFSSFEKPLA